MTFCGAEAGASAGLSRFTPLLHSRLRVRPWRYVSASIGVKVGRYCAYIFPLMSYLMGKQTIIHL